MRPIIGHHHRPAEFRRTATDPTREGCAVEVFNRRGRVLGDVVVGVAIVCGLFGLLAAWFAGWLQ